MTLGSDERDEYADKPYGDPRRAANIRWESRSERVMRVGRGALGTAFHVLAWPFKKLGMGLVRAGGGLTGTGYSLYNTGRDIYHWRRDDE